jgi:hypothetical protein
VTLTATPTPTIITYVKGRRDMKHHFIHLSHHPSEQMQLCHPHYLKYKHKGFHVTHHFSLYMWQFNFRQSTWDKIRKENHQKRRASVFKCKLIPILENIFLIGQLGLMQTCLDRRAPPLEQKTPPSTWNKNVVPSPIHVKPSHWLIYV